jgi:hypothetical protein
MRQVGRGLRRAQSSRSARAVEGVPDWLNSAPQERRLPELSLATWLSLPFPAKNSGEQTFFRLLGDKSKTEYVSAELDLMFDVLQHFPLAWS